MTNEGARPVALDRQREATIAMLCEHFALDHLPAGELELRIDRAHAARTMDDLRALVANLPALAGQPARLDITDLEASQSVVAIMGGTERRGTWIPARTIRVFTLMGGAVLDFREVPLPRGTVNLEIYTVMGGVEILVPPGIRVSCEGTGIMGGFEQQAGTSASAELSDITLRVTGIALMGGVSIVERLPGESAGDAKRRRKEEKRKRRSQS